MQKKVLVTGASGFIGSFLVEGGLERGMQVWAGVRRSSSRAYLQQEGLRFAELDFTDTDRLETQLRSHQATHGGWDYIIHCAGVTKCLDSKDFEIGNYWATRNFVETLQRVGMCPKLFVFISSLSVFGPIREDDYTPIRETDVPCPNTAYGVSKLKTEHYLQELPDFPVLIYRPTGVYGPRERDYFLMVQSIKKHVDFRAGFHRQDITFIYVKDLVQAVYLGIEKERAGRSYFVSDGGVYNSREFSDLICAELGNPFVWRFVCPLWLLAVISFVVEKAGKLLRKPTTLNMDKYQIMKQRNWRCDIRPLVEELGYQPQYDLRKGVKEIIRWYKEAKWI